MKERIMRAAISVVGLRARLSGSVHVKVAALGKLDKIEAVDPQMFEKIMAEKYGYRT